MSGLGPHSGRCVVSLSKIYLPPKSTGYTQDAVAPSRYDRKIVYWDAKQKKKNNKKHVSQNWPGHPESVLPFFLHFFLNTGKIFRIKFCFGLQDISRPMLHEIPENWINEALEGYLGI